MKFRDLQHGLCSDHTYNPLGAGWDTLWRTSDGGDTWLYCTDEGEQDLLFSKTYNRWVRTFYNGLSFSTNDGITWDFNQILNIGPQSDNGIAKYSFINDSIGYAITSFGLIYKTVDGGKTWFQQDVPDGFSQANHTNRIRPADIVAVSELEAYALFDSVVIRTIDGGGTLSTYIKPLQSNPTISITSNPVYDNLTLALNELASLSYLEIFDALGRRVMTGMIPAGSTNYRTDVSRLSAGVYLARVGENEVRFIKL
jgi:hypothetical protein